MPYVAAEANSKTRKANTGSRSRQWSAVYESSRARGDDEGTAHAKASGVVKKDWEKTNPERRKPVDRRPCYMKAAEDPGMLPGQEYTLRRNATSGVSRSQFQQRGAAVGGVLGGSVGALAGRRMGARMGLGLTAASAALGAGAGALAGNFPRTSKDRPSSSTDWRVGEGGRHVQTGGRIGGVNYKVVQKAAAEHDGFLKAAGLQRVRRLMTARRKGKPVAKAIERASEKMTRRGKRYTNDVLEQGEMSTASALHPSHPLSEGSNLASYESKVRPQLMGKRR